MPRDPHICKGLGTIRSADFPPDRSSGHRRRSGPCGCPEQPRGGGPAAACRGEKPVSQAVRPGHFAGSWSSHGASRRWHL